MRPTRRTLPCTLVDMQPNSQRSAPPSAVRWTRQGPKRIGRKWQSSNVPTSVTGPTWSGCLPRAPSGCPHSRTCIEACMPALLLAAPCSLYCCLPMPCCCSSAPCCSPGPHAERLRLLALLCPPALARPMVTRMRVMKNL
jgi:hypothetical protein